MPSSFRPAMFALIVALTSFFVSPVLAAGYGDVKDTDVHGRLKAYFDSVPGIDTHSHMGGPPLPRQGVPRPNQAEGTLCRLWHRCYLTWGHPLAPWPKDGDFDAWWNAASRDFSNYRARSAYRCMLPIFEDLYGVDFDTLTLAQARELNDKMGKNRQDAQWCEDVIVKRANTELVVVDRLAYHVEPAKRRYSFQVFVSSVRRFVNGFHPSEFAAWPAEDPYAFAAQRKLPIRSLDDYEAVLDRILVEAKQAGAVALKTHMAYERTLKIDRVPKQTAEQAFGKTRKELTPTQVKAFQDYIFWRTAELAAKHELPFQIHTGHAEIPGSNPMNLVEVIRGNPKTRFILFHGGFPWVGESGMVALKYPNVYLDSVWLPTLSHTMGKRALKEWLDMISSNRIMWGSDTGSIEGTYGMTLFARRCITEALAEKVIDKELSEEDAKRIGRQILRENALEAIPLLRKHLENPAAKR